MEYLIRDFQASDINTLVALCREHAHYERAEYNSPDNGERLKKALLGLHPPLHCWLVLVNNNIVGYVSYTFDFSTWDAGFFLHLDCLYLREDFRGLGIGEEIMKKLKVIAIEKDCVNIQWQTPIFNEKGIRFYERIGAKALDKKRFSLAL